jgi:hypothetical protein
MNTNLKEIDNYEIIHKLKDTVITYSLSDCNALVDLEEVKVIAIEKENSSYDLIVKNLEGSDLVKFKSLDSTLVDELIGKRIILAGFSEKTNDIEEATLITSFNIEKMNKIRLGR